MNFRYRDWRVIARFRGLPGLQQSAGNCDKPCCCK